jgi:CBS domain-containing protein
MTVHLIGTDGRATVRLKQTPRFEALSEVGAAVPDTPLAPSQQLRAAKLTCQTGGPVRTGMDCLCCSRFAGWRPGPAPHEVTIRCCWSDGDLVASRMTCAAALITIAPDAPVREALVLAQRHTVSDLPVIANGRMIGLWSRGVGDDAAADALPVGARMATDVLGIHAHATLGEAVAAMRLFQVSCLPVVDRDLLVGLLTRGDLRRAGVTEELLGAIPGAGREARSGQRGEDAGSIIELGEAE